MDTQKVNYNNNLNDKHIDEKLSEIKLKDLNNSSGNPEDDELDESDGQAKRTGCFAKIPFSGKDLIIVILLCYGNFCVGSAYSLLAPFFPSEAGQKGASATWSGLIIAEYQIALFLGASVFGKFIPHVTPKYLITIGLFAAGICNALFGILQWSPSGATFIAIGMITRTFEGLGVASFFVACWTIVCLRFPKHISKLFATTEMCYGVGMIFGPAIGGILNQVGKDSFGNGFCLPFFVMGPLLLLASTLMFFLLTEEETSQKNGSIGDGDKITAKLPKTSVFGVLSHISITLNVLISVNCFLLIGFNEATLELHLEKISNLSSTTTGGIFVISGALYAGFNQIWAYFAEKMTNCHPLCILGCCSSFLAFLIVGPVPFIPVESSVWISILGQVFLGLGMGGQFVGSFVQGLRETLKSGYPDSIDTYAVISGIYSSSFALGSAIGPALGGVLTDVWGYRMATVPICALQLFMIVIIVSYDLIIKFRSKSGTQIA